MDDRFAFGKNWSGFLEKMTPARIREAEQSLEARLGDIRGKSFLDIGSGSGLFSLAARNLGARVVSFDYDPDSVACTERLRAHFRSGDADWRIFRGSVLDRDMLLGLGRFDIVYSWGVLHHTGDLWQAMENAAVLVAPGGSLFIAIYNDQGGYSDVWRGIKKLYNHSPNWGRFLITLGVVLFFEGRSLLIQLLRLRNPFRWWKARRQERGMDLWIDARDWAGGYPFEVAKPERVFEFCFERGFDLTRLRTNGGGIACNEYVFRKRADETCVE